MHDYLLATIGGVLIGSSAIVMMAILGRLTGVSGLLWSSVEGLIAARLKQIPWQLLFVIGLVAGALLAHQIFGIAIPASNESGVVLAIIAGLIVGFGTNLGSGCTSGHGVCGTSRLSVRSIIATGAFMLLGIITVFIAKHLLGII